MAKGIIKMQELQQIVDNKLKAMTEDGSLAKRIEEGIESAVNKAINSQFESYGEITKQIEKAIKEGLQINLKDMPFESYNQQMLVAVKQKLTGLFAAEAGTKFIGEIDKILAPAPSEMSIVELINSVAESWKTDEYWAADELDEYASVALEEHSSALHGSFTLKMWKQKESGGFSSFSSRTNSEDLHLFLCDREEGGHTIRINHSMSYNPTCFQEHEALIFKLYSAGTVITGCSEFDEDDCELLLKEELY